MYKRAAVLGPAGSFSEEAAIEQFGRDIVCIYGKDFNELLDIVERKEADVAILPLRTSQGGPVGEALDAMANHSLYITCEWDFTPTYCLLGKNKMREVKTIGSHRQALIVFEEYLDRKFPNVCRVETPSTSYAAELASNDPSFVAIASPSSAKRYRLKTIHEIKSPKETEWKPTPEELLFGIKPR